LKTTVDFSRSIRKTILNCAQRAHVGHIGSSLSITDIIAVLYNQIFPILEDNLFTFILSKGHAALAVYAALTEIGVLTEEEMLRYCQDDTLLGTHPDYRIPGIELSTGSLGMGFGAGAGFALAAKIRGQQRKVFVLLSDGEIDEGVVWETAMFAAHQKLSNLIAIVDYNRQQALGSTENVLNLDPLEERWSSFGWQVKSIDGHNLIELTDTLLSTLNNLSGQPQVIIARTVSGHGVSFMEKKVEWHYLPMSDQEYWQALKEIEE
jgi:transketolase